MWSGVHVAVVIPAFNEVERIGETLKGLPSVIDPSVIDPSVIDPSVVDPSVIDEILVIDDASTDGTAERALECGDERVRVLVHAANQGVGAAIRTGYKEALRGRAAAVVVMAADNQMDPLDLPSLLRPVLNGEADYAKGNRFMHVEHKRMPPLRRMGSRFLSWLTRVTTGLAVDDCQCGFTAVGRDMLLRLPLDELWRGYGYPNDLLALLAHHGARVVDVPVRPIYAGESSGLHAGHVLSIAARITRRYFHLRQSAPAHE